MQVDQLARACTRGAMLSVLTVLVALPASAQSNGSVPDAITKESWLSPPAELADEILAPRHLNVSLTNPSPNRKWFLRQESEGMPSMASFAKPHYYLGGLQVDWQANRARSLTTRGSAGLAVISAENGKTVEIAVPDGATISNPQWSPDGSAVAYFANFDDATHIYVADATTGRSRKLTKTPVLATLYTAFEWSGDGRTILAVTLPAKRGAPPPKADVPTEPLVRFTDGGKNPTRTYASLLASPHEMALLEYYTTGQLTAIEVRSGSARNVGKPAMFRGLDLAPDGKYVRVTVMQKPFSYIVPVNMFGTIEEIWSLDGTTRVHVSTEALRDGSPPDTTREQAERRNLAWRPDGQGLVYLQQDPAPRRDNAQTDAPAEGNRQQQRRKDRLVQWLPPFDSTNTKTLYESDTRMSSVSFNESMTTVFVTEGGGGGRGFGRGDSGGSSHTYAVVLSDPSKKYTIARTRSGDDAFYEQPGTLVTRRGPMGGTVVQTSSDGKFVYLEGTQYFKDARNQAPRPFLDKVEITTGTKQRIFQSSADMYESVVSVLDDDATSLIVSRESATQVPDSYRWSEAGRQVTKLTNNRDYNPTITRATRRIIDIERPDGMKFQAEVTLPPDYRAGEKRPAMFWFYPREYTSQDDYDRTNQSYNKNRFPNLGVRSMDYLIKLGYVLVEPDAPIFGEQGQMNNNYVHDLRNNLAAVIDELDRQGLIDRSRLGLGGHSYGAFSTVNAMVHTPFFKAGIAGDGNYNRTLTPNNFQSERRDLWEAREVYSSMSPFFYANNLTGALLMYHGMDDQNVGTSPINSERLFHALDGLGKTVSLYMYPYEDHGPATKETILDMWARWAAWLDTYVKNAGKADQKVTTN